MARRELSLDFETFSTHDIFKSGMAKYMSCLLFEIILFAWAFDDEPVQVVDDMSKVPQEVIDALTDPNIIKTAFKADFEMNAIKAHFGIEMDPRQWRCTMVKAMMLGLPGSLDGVGTVLNLDIKKDKKGKALIRYFCVPCKPTKTNGRRTRNTKHTDPEKWAEFMSYCRDDVDTERLAKRAMAWFEPQAIEHEIWCMDQTINRRGVALDLDLVHAAIDLGDVHKQEAMADVAAITGLEVPTLPKVKVWMEDQLGFEITSLDKDAIPKLIDKIEDGPVKDVLRIRQELGKSSISKFEAMIRQMVDGLMMDMVQYYGAGRTGRWAGRGVQPHNLPRQEEADFCKGLVMLDQAREWAKDGNMEALEMVFGNVPKVLSQLIRTAFVPRPGHVFLPADFSAIEARVTAWLAGEAWRLQVFNSHGKIYEASASQMFKVPIETIDKGSPLRQRGKVAELALGFGGGPAALIRMGALEMDFMKEFTKRVSRHWAKITKGKGVLTEVRNGKTVVLFENEKSYVDHYVLKELAKLVKMWRNANQAITRYWREVEDRMVEAVENPGLKVDHKFGVSFKVERNVLFITLPSGRRLAYQDPKLIPGKFEGTKQVTYMVWQKKAWWRTSTYGGKITENIVQAVARDLLAYAMLRLEKAKLPVALHVHDEAVPEVPEAMATASMPLVNRLMSQQPPWAKGLPLKAESYIAKYYRKED